jgi:hypothetical protein
VIQPWSGPGSIQPYAIRDVSEGLVDGAHETLGTKKKVWLREPSGRRVLFKEARLNTGEDWSERLAADLAGLLGLPHAHVDLAVRHGVRGVAVDDFIPAHHDLVHGNELMSGCFLGYPRDQRWGVRQHSPGRIREALEGLHVGIPSSPSVPRLGDGFDLLVGYLLLDAWIGNTDRHHENWGVIAGADGFVMAPTFDHASSLGRELTRDWFERRRGARSVDRLCTDYAERARSALYAESGEGPLSPTEAFQLARQIRPAAAGLWLERLAGVSTTEFAELVTRVPQDLLDSQIGAFVAELLEYNQGRLLRLV